MQTQNLYTLGTIIQQKVSLLFVYDIFQKTLVSILNYIHVSIYTLGRNKIFV